MTWRCGRFLAVVTAGGWGGRRTRRCGRWCGAGWWCRGWHSRRTYRRDDGRSSGRDAWSRARGGWYDGRVGAGGRRRRLRRRGWVAWTAGRVGLLARCRCRSFTGRRLAWRALRAMAGAADGFRDQRCVQVWPSEQAAGHQNQVADGGDGERRTSAANHATTASGRVDEDGRPGRGRSHKPRIVHATDESRSIPKTGNAPSYPAPPPADEQLMPIHLASKAFLTLQQAAMGLCRTVFERYKSPAVLHRCRSGCAGFRPALEFGCAAPATCSRLPSFCRFRPHSGFLRPLSHIHRRPWRRRWFVPRLVRWRHLRRPVWRRRRRMLL